MRCVQSTSTDRESDPKCNSTDMNTWLSETSPSITHNLLENHNFFLRISFVEGVVLFGKKNCFSESISYICTLLCFKNRWMMSCICKWIENRWNHKKGIMKVKFQNDVKMQWTFEALPKFQHFHEGMLKVAGIPKKSCLKPCPPLWFGINSK